MQQSLEAFESTYIKKDFDSILLQQSNSLINSNIFYLKYKQRYIEETLKNYNEYKDTISKLFDLRGPISNDPYKVYKTICDPSFESCLLQKEKNVIKKQTYIFQNFLHYIQFLNENKHVLTSKENSPAEGSMAKKNIFALFAPKMKKKRL
jgi:hypothetical protein